MQKGAPAARNKRYGVYFRFKKCIFGRTVDYVISLFGMSIFSIKSDFLFFPRALLE